MNRGNYSQRSATIGSDEAAQVDGAPEADRHADARFPQALLQDERHDLPARGAECTTNADFFGALRDVVGQHAVDADG